MTNRTPRLHRLVLLYALCAGAWIMISDTLLLVFVNDPATVQRWQTVKGWAFVVVTSLLLYVVLRWERRARQQVEDALRQSEARYRDLYHDAPYAYFAVDADGRVQLANRRAVELLGYPMEELLGRPAFDLYADTPAGKESARQILARFRAGERIEEQELEMQRADGEPVWISLTVHPVLDAQGRVVQSRSMVIDISRRKQAEEALRKSRALLNETQRITKVGGWEYDLAAAEMVWTDEV